LSLNVRNGLNSRLPELNRSTLGKLANTPGPSGICCSSAFIPNEKSPPCTNVPSARLIETARSTFAVAIAVAVAVAVSDGPLRLAGHPDQADLHEVTPTPG